MDGVCNAGQVNLVVEVRNDWLAASVYNDLNDATITSATPSSESASLNYADGIKYAAGAQLRAGFRLNSAYLPATGNIFTAMLWCCDEEV
jgi:hypothetical protein